MPLSNFIPKEYAYLSENTGSFFIAKIAKKS